jgi:hypothetical protein
LSSGHSCALRPHGELPRARALGSTDSDSEILGGTPEFAFQAISQVMLMGFVVVLGVFCRLGFGLRAYTLRHSTSPFFVMGWP